MNIEIKQLGSIKLELLSTLRPHLTFSDFCPPAGTIEFNAYKGFLRNSVKLFSLTYCDFVFEAKIHDGIVFIKRNELYQHSEQYLGNEPCHVALQWAADSIGCGIVPHGSLTDMNYHMRSTRTPIMVPPAQIVTILRKENLLFNNAYPNMNDLFSAILDSIHCCQEDIRRYGAEAVLWETKNGTLKPRNEPEISKVIASYLNIYGVQKNFDVICEPIVGTGKADFYVVAPVSDIQGLGKVIIEAKKADSSDLVHGFTAQLPDYMQRMGTDYGIYLIYWLKSTDYPYPSQDSYAELEIHKLHPIPRLKTVRTVGMDLSIAIPPSKR